MLNLLSKATYASKQVCVWCSRTGAYYTTKQTFSHGSSINGYPHNCTSDGCNNLQLQKFCHKRQ